ncbi:hypothetical protein G3578_14755 [Brevibacillus sp. SYP-B805]|uniref:hypothetical protein n=1 Tax=Brevibacillus sp. SYP-B805 TaxID=1578199 RepID=UPI0013ED919D|nr:hypothetical protein [Brevibacillus sp. SYP-B805]NGQ96421.1 hypothetical protein [Brevibacillus sp. SYP-B805]
MGQLLATIMNVMVLLMVPLGVLQAHVVLQMKSELLEISMAATKYVTNHGGKNDAEVVNQLRQFIHQELAEKSYRLDENDIRIEVARTKAADPILWSHEDEFRLRLSIPYPQLTALFPDWPQLLDVERTGTINVMDYDL